MEVLIKKRTGYSFIRYLKTVGLLALFWVGFGFTQEREPQAEYKVKAVFLYNFSHFVQWPPQSFATPDAPLVIGVLGENPFGDYLKATVKNEQFQNRTYQIRNYQSVDELSDAQILFVSKSEEVKMEKILTGLANHKILTVSDSEDFAVKGGMIQFVKKDNRIKLMINLEAAQQAGVEISPKLLSLAEIVRTNFPEGK